MGVRFRKSFKILPGVRLNLNKKSASMTFGGKGLRYTVNSNGRRTTTTGIPGTGLSYSSSSTVGHDSEPEHEPVTSSKSRLITLILCVCTVFIHRFYVRKYFTAVLYLLTAGLLGIGWIYDIVTISKGKFTDGDGDYIETWMTPSTKPFLIVFCILYALGLVITLTGRA